LDWIVVVTVTVFLTMMTTVSAKTENSFISAVISGRYCVAYLLLFSPWWF